MARELVYESDVANTGFDHNIAIQGWHVDDVRIDTGTHAYETTFGVPGETGYSSYANAVVSIFVHRDAMGLFWKLLAAVYVSFLVCILSFFMDPSKDGIFNGRVGLLVGMIFAVVINSQRVATALGQSPSFSLVDKIHVVTLCALVLALVAAMISRRFYVTDRAGLARRVDHRLAAALLVAYVVVNTLMISHAANAAAGQ